MRPLLFFFLFMFLFQVLNAQDKPPKLRYYQGFFSVNYELGEKTIEENEVLLHLEKHSTEGYYHFKRSISMDWTSAIFGLIGAGSGVWMLIESRREEVNINRTITAGSLFIVGSGVGLILPIISKSKKKKGIDIYNRKFEY